MQKVNVDVHIWNELRSNDRFGFKLSSCIRILLSFLLSLPCFIQYYYAHYYRCYCHAQEEHYVSHIHHAA